MFTTVGFIAVAGLLIALVAIRTERANATVRIVRNKRG